MFAYSIIQQVAQANDEQAQAEEVPEEDVLRVQAAAAGQREALQ